MEKFMEHLKPHLAQECCIVQMAAEQKVPQLSIMYPFPVLTPFLRYEFQPERAHSSNFYNTLVLSNFGQIFLSGYFSLSCSQINSEMK